MLQEFFYQLDLTQLVLYALTVIGSAIAWFYRAHLRAWLDFWLSVLEGLRSIPALEADVKGIRRYVSPNGGGSLFDSVSRTEATVTALAEQVSLVMQTMWAENDSDDDVGRFYCNAAGENVYVNQLYARWVGVGKAELMGWNYFNFIHPDDAERVRKHWDMCRNEHRQYRIRHRMVTADGSIFEVDVVATPIPDAAPALRWIGFVRKHAYVPAVQK